MSNRQAEEMLALSDRQRRSIRDLREEISQLRDLKRDLGHAEENNEIQHPLIRTVDANRITADQIRKHPERIFEVVSARKEMFSRGDIARSLAEYIDDPGKLTLALEQALASPELVSFDTDSSQQTYTTRNYRRAETSLHRNAIAMADCAAFGVEPTRMERRRPLRRYQK